MLQVLDRHQMEAELEEKLKNELESSDGLFSKSFLKDIQMFLLLNEWEDDVLCALLKKQGIIDRLAHAVYNDDIFSEFFEKRLKQLVGLLHNHC